MPEGNKRLEVPPPRLVAAWLLLDAIGDPSQVPMWAAHWIVDGLDTPALRDLAGLDARDPYDVRDLTARTLAEMSIEVADVDEAAELVLTELARRCLAGRTDERDVAAQIEDIYIRSGYSDAILRQPLGAAYGFDDEWSGGWGRTDSELRVAVRAACREQLALHA